MKMLIVVYILLMLRVGRKYIFYSSSYSNLIHDSLLFSINLCAFYFFRMFTGSDLGDKTVDVRQHVTLTCDRQKSGSKDTLFWFRIVSGNLPEFLGGTFYFNYTGVNKTPHFTAKQEPGTFILDIQETQLSDTGFYYCIEVSQLDMTFLKGTFLNIKGPEPDITAVIQNISSDPVRPGDSVTLQCSVLSDSENKTCPEEHSVIWFRARSDESHPSLIYAQRNSRDECEKSPEDPSAQKCVYSFSKDVSSSDAGTYYCAVATCGEILFGNGTKVDIQAPDLWDLQMAHAALFLLFAALAISLIVIAFLLYTIKKTCNHSNDAVTLQRNAASQQRDEDSLVYSAPTFTNRKAGRAERRNVNAAEGRDDLH
ncbi:uncharacterized protein LOC121947646 [Plectropomus leopardus]|uniref:uncharacterized protein LOC121947646 n=1 Tax=Plectropomus leopardus TaxID=160734 RepID=UPI001C4C1C10|nr:uncharacterized protein LOC121947646 [Plectropomus leopardus]